MPINSEIFEDLANILTFDLVQKHHKSLFQLEALFFGVAGLLNDELTDSYYTGLQNEYQFMRTKYGLKEVASIWKFGKMRPSNLPTVKIAQLAGLFHHVPLFISEVLRLPSTSVIKEMLDFDLSDYWTTHYTFGKISTARKKNISSSFVNHLFLNAIIPFVFFYQREKTESEMDVAITYLESIPAEKNTIISNWKSIDVACSSSLSSQALLHLYKTYCVPKRCLDCTIGKKLLLRA